MDFEILVAQERIRQEEKWGEQNHNPALWLPILVEEVGEIATAILGLKFAPEAQRAKHLETEIIQVAAVCKAMWESGKRNGWI